MKRKFDSIAHERHYYKETGKKLVAIQDEQEHRKIDKYMKKHSTTPPRTSRESGYSVYLFKGKHIEVNSSMVKRQKIDNEHFLISRAVNAPALPVSCLASTEHVIAMQDKVEDFKSEFEPSTKQKVMYQILLSCCSKKLKIQHEKRALLNLLKKYDDTLSNENVRISYNKKRSVFEITVGTQVADIQLLVRALSSKSKYKIIDCDFKGIGLNEGVCLVKKDASNPIHALANIANSDSEKGFLERDAGSTSGLYTASYQDSQWTFNFFTSLDDLRNKTEYPEDTLAIKIVNSN
ncbi:hypothetical protein [Legionella waltersii]|uniref:Uncharacterized protein n=1 Tax=Legionella waltersii TaxID=66969 RepID=A0A0W1AK68_9GAMM|nr:hypothetical protein [Legionella waltersii]KTD81756.1 hypothetical protein Lwal_1008 [Legionella waltersii]SNU97110.1 Uncharacterised protein [Legionella waltersii]